MAADSTMGTLVRCLNNSSKPTSMVLTTPFAPVSPDRPAIHPGAPIRISSGDGVSHHGLISAGGIVFESFGSSSVSGPARSAGAARNVVAIKNRLTIQLIKVD